MHITVVGPGALGCLFAALLARAQNTVWLLDHNEKRLAHLHDQGIILEADSKEIHIPVHSTSDPGAIGRTDAVLLCVKSHDVKKALEHLEPLITDCGALLIALQNGIGHHDALCQAGHFAVGITAQGGTLVGPGRVVHGGAGQTVLGFLPTDAKVDDSKLSRVAKVFNSAQLPTTVSGSIICSIWDKLVVNVGINALTAIHNCRNGELLNDPLVAKEQELAVKEAVEIAAAKGILLSANPVARVAQVCRATSSNVSSMLQDVRRGRRTEIDAINGAIVREGKKLGISTPVNKKLVAAVEAIELAQQVK